MKQTDLSSNNSRPNATETWSAHKKSHQSSLMHTGQITNIKGGDSTHIQTYTDRYNLPIKTHNSSRTCRYMRASWLCWETGACAHTLTHINHLYTHYLLVILAGSQPQHAPVCVCFVCLSVCFRSVQSALVFMKSMCVYLCVKYWKSQSECECQMGLTVTMMMCMVKKDEEEEGIRILHWLRLAG